MSTLPVYSLTELFEQHQIWMKTGGAEGHQLVIDGKHVFNHPSDLTPVGTVNIDMVHLRDSVLTGVHVANATLTGLTLDSCDLSRSTFTNVSFAGGAFTNCLFNHSNFNGVSEFLGTTLTGTSFMQCKMYGIALMHLAGTGVRFDFTRMYHATVEYSDLQDSRWWGAKANSATFSRVNLDGSVFIGAECEGTIFLDSTLRDIDASFATFSGGQFCNSEVTLTNKVVHTNFTNVWSDNPDLIPDITL